MRTILMACVYRLWSIYELFVHLYEIFCQLILLLIFYGLFPFGKIQRGLLQRSENETTFSVSSFVLFTEKL